MLISCAFLLYGFALSFMLVSKVPHLQKHALKVLNVKLYSKEYDGNWKTKFTFPLGMIIISYLAFHIMILFLPVDQLFEASKGILPEKGVWSNLKTLELNKTSYLTQNVLGSDMYIKFICLSVWLFNHFYAIKLKNRYIHIGNRTEKFEKKMLKNFLQ